MLLTNWHCQYDKPFYKNIKNVNAQTLYFLLIFKLNLILYKIFFALKTGIDSFDRIVFGIISNENLQSVQCRLALLCRALKP